MKPLTLMKFKIIVLVTMLTCTSVRCFSQSEVMSWQCDSVTNLINNDRFAFSCFFKIYNDKIEWIQKGGEETFAFNIVSSQGALLADSVSTIEYNIEQESSTGKLRIERMESSKVKVILNLTENNPNGAYYRFHVYNP
jgi:hypothetical protein